MSSKKVESEVIKLEEDLGIVFSKLESEIKKPIKREDIYIKQLKLRKEFVDWTIKKFRMLKSASPEHVFKRDVFYCELGYNVGSEQKEKRPVVILQNNRGNNSSTTTICAPITTHQNCSVYEEDGKKFYKYTDSNGEEKCKKLDYYEIPIDLDKQSKVIITGFINLAQIKTISKKRLSNAPVAKISIDNEKQIKDAFNKLLFS